MLTPLTARFCLLEQYLPDGPDHPFAKTMLKHFDKLQTPLKSIKKYPSLETQRSRFLNREWRSVDIQSLWSLWTDLRYLSEEQRISLDHVEPFDEWEEFALFASHYFLLVASNDKASKVEYGALVERNGLSEAESSVGYEVICSPNPSQTGRRRYGASWSVSDEAFALHGGLGPQSRLTTSDLYATSDAEASEIFSKLPPSFIPARMCHTITQLDHDRFLLVGGRASPDCAMADCWLSVKGAWSRCHDLPAGRYRHCATAVELESGLGGVLIYGGKDSQGHVLSDWHLWDQEHGWRQVEYENSSIEPVFGASLVRLGSRYGAVFGGMTIGGVLSKQVRTWSITEDDHSRLTMDIFNQATTLQDPCKVERLVCRLGSTTCVVPGGILLAGGVSLEGVQSRAEEIVLLKFDTTNERAITWEPRRISLSLEVPRPLLVGHSMTSGSGGLVQIAGGGAVCFSFGTHWNESLWTFSDHVPSPELHWSLQQPTSDPVHDRFAARSLTYPKDPSREDFDHVATSEHVPSESSQSMTILRTEVKSASDFEILMNKGQPVILEGLNLGSCTQKWTLPYLKETVGNERQVIVHDSPAENMDFLSKNFKYVTKSFSSFIDDIAAGQRQYLRSLSSEAPSKQPAQLADDFPTIASDFSLPDELAFVAENMHSSPLRVSGPVNMWLHYDVMANIYCQIHGSKRMLLFPPSDVSHLGFAPGASSSPLVPLDTDIATHPSLKHTTPYEASLKPGDVLFIPALWPHTASPVDTTSVAVNVFFRSLSTGYAAGRDVYGNRDLQAYEKGRKDLEKIGRAFDGLPPETRRFYLERLADELKAKAVNG